MNVTLKLLSGASLPLRLPAGASVAELRSAAAVALSHACPRSLRLVCVGRVLEDADGPCGLCEGAVVYALSLPPSAESSRPAQDEAEELATARRARAAAWARHRAAEARVPAPAEEEDDELGELRLRNARLRPWLARVAHRLVALGVPEWLVVVLLPSRPLLPSKSSL
jgi:hypothetical protein